MYEDGKMSGYGTYYFSNDCKYDGEWKHNLPSGKGKYIFDDKIIYDGQWYEGQKHGKGILKDFVNKCSYKGKFINDVFI